MIDRIRRSEDSEVDVPDALQTELRFPFFGKVGIVLDVVGSGSLDVVSAG